MKNKLILFLFVFLLMACKNDDDTDKPKRTEPDKKTYINYNPDEFLLNYASSITNSFSELNETTNQFNEAFIQFEKNQNATNLEKLKKEWAKVYFTWVKTSAYNIGPAGAKGSRRTLIDEIGSFPIDKNRIEEKIKSNDFKINDALRNTRGLIAVEYLLFHKDSETTLNQLNKNRLAYLKAIINDLTTRINIVENEWRNDYSTFFVQNKGTNVKSSITLLFNSWYTSFMLMKKNKIGIPLGKYASNNEAQPKSVENYDSQTSILHLKQSIKTLEEIYTGGERKMGWDDYIASKEPNGKELEIKLSDQIKLIQKKIDQLDSEQALTEQITKNRTTLTSVFEELKKLEILIKTEMSSLLSLAVTASDKDGD